MGAAVATAVTLLLAACAPPAPPPAAAPSPTTVSPATAAPTTPSPSTTAPSTTTPTTTTTTSRPTTTTAPASTTTSTTTPTTTTTPATTTTLPAGDDTQQPGAGAAASKDVFLTNCWDVVAMSDAQLDMWKSRGVGGFVCSTGYLYNIGGKYTFTGDAGSSLTGTAFDLQREIKGTKIVSRAAARGITLWLGTSMTNYFSGTAPFGDWFDNSTWSSKVLPAAGNLAAAAKLLGFAGVAFDSELYAGAGAPGSWNWNYPGNTHSEAAVRSQARLRGAQLMSALVGAYPNIDLIAFHMELPEGWSELVQQQINGISNAYQDEVTLEFWDGMTSVSGYGPVRLMDHVYNKTSHLFQSTWDTAFTYDLNRMSAMFSRRLSNWAYASSAHRLGPVRVDRFGAGPVRRGSSSRGRRGAARSVPEVGHRRCLPQLRVPEAELLRLHAVHPGDAGRSRARHRGHLPADRHGDDDHT